MTETADQASSDSSALQELLGELRCFPSADGPGHADDVQLRPGIPVKKRGGFRKSKSRVGHLNARDPEPRISHLTRYDGGGAAFDRKFNVGLAVFLIA